MRMRKKFGLTLCAAGIAMAVGATTAQADSDKLRNFDVKYSMTAEQKKVSDLFDSLPTSPVKFGDRLSRSGLSAEDKAYLASVDGQDICGVPDMAQTCEYYGPTTIRKVANYSHSQAATRTGLPKGAQIDPMKIALLEEGARRNLVNAVLDKGLSEQQFAQLMPGEQIDSRAGAAKKIGKTKWLVAFRCANHTQSGQTGWWYPFNTSRLTTCAVAADVRFSFWFLSVETGVTAAHSSLWRRLGFGDVGAWIPDGTERSVCASSRWNNNNSGPRCNMQDWISKISVALGIAFNQAPVPISGSGTAERLTVPQFNTNITFQ